jgi:hypothetical protein
MTPCKHYIGVSAARPLATIENTIVARGFAAEALKYTVTATKTPFLRIMILSRIETNFLVPYFYIIIDFTVYQIFNVINIFFFKHLKHLIQQLLYSNIW